MWRDSMQVLIGQEKFHLISYDVIIDPKPVKFSPAEHDIAEKQPTKF